MTRGISGPGPETEPRLQQWKLGILTTRPLGNSQYSLKLHEQSCLVQDPLFFWLSLGDVISPGALFIIHVAWWPLNCVVRAWFHSRASGWVPPTSWNQTCPNRTLSFPHTPAPPEFFLRMTPPPHWGSIRLQVFWSWFPHTRSMPITLAQATFISHLPRCLPSDLLSTPQPGSSFRNASLFIHVTSLQRRKTVLWCLPIYYYKGEDLNLTSCSQWRVLFILLGTLPQSFLPGILPVLPLSVLHDLAEWMWCQVTPL